MSNYQKLPEYKAAEKAYQTVVSAAGEYEQVRKAAAEQVSSALAKMAEQLIEANATLDDANSEMAGEQLRRGITTEVTAEKVKVAQAEVDRLKTTFDSIARTSSLAINEIEEKISGLNFQLYEHANTKRAISEIFVHPDDQKGARKISAMIAECDNKQAAIRAEIVNAGQILSKLGPRHANMKTDSWTKSIAQKVLDTTVNAWIERQNIQNDIALKIEKCKAEIDNLKEKCQEYEEARSSADPAFLADVLYTSGVDATLWPETWIGRKTGFAGPRHIELKLRTEVEKRQKTP